MRITINGLAIWVLLSGVAVNTVLAGGGVSRPPDQGEETFYTRPAMFSTRPSSKTEFTQTVARFGPVGIGIELHPPAFVMKIKNIEEGSPAEATGELKPGQIIETINGQRLKDIDPRITLGNMIGEAEATDGKVVLAVRDDAKSPIKNVTVTIPVLGAYSETWPLNCPKSDKIVRALADRFAEQKWEGRIDLNGPKMLFMLSTGDERDLQVVRGWIKTSVEKNQNFGDNRFVYQWFTSWGGPCLAEYYLRTGDESILPILQKACDAVRTTMYHDAWGGRGVAAHHMGHAGTGTLTMLLLARQCGVEVEERMLQAALQHFYRFAGKGANPYMDAYPEQTFTDNGRNGRLAFAMAAASALDPKGNDSVYAMARDIAAISSFYSGTYMNHGHTGGGIGEVWRSAAMGLMVDLKPALYREFMDNRMWWYDISRRYNGEFGILGGGSYDKEEWGITMGLTYTAPRKNLCIFGAPRSKYAKNYKIPSQPWGTEADDAFLSLDAAADENGHVANTDNEKFAEMSGVAFHRYVNSVENMSDDQIREYARHPQYMYRLYASSRIYKDMRVHLIPELMKDKDARVRYVGVSAMPMPRVSSRPERCDPGFPQDKVTDEILEILFDSLNDPEESWYVVDSVLQVLSRRPAQELAPHADRIASFLAHDEWWVRHSALKAMVPLALDLDTYEKAMAAIEKDVPSFIRPPRSLEDFAKKLADADPKIQRAGAELLGNVYDAYPGRSADPPGGLHPSGLSEKNYLGTIAKALQVAPGGLDILFEMGKKRYDYQVLPHRDLFLQASDDAISPDMRTALQSLVMQELIPEHVGRHWPNLAKEAKGGSIGDWRDPIVQLADLYKKAGDDSYGWTAFGTDRLDNEWEYFSFDPPEKVKLVNERTARYREVTYPAGMETWYAKDFDAKAAGWKTGVAPIANFDGTLENSSSCSNPVCGCGDPAKSLWEKEVLLMRRTFELPPLQDGYRYRMIVGGASHVGVGDGYRVYVNGKQITEAKSYGGRGSGGQPDGTGISPDFFDEFKGGKVVVAATSFLRQHHRSHKIRGFMNIWFQKQKIPPFTEEQYLKAAKLIPMTSTEWQDLQDPAQTNTDPSEGKTFYDGVFNPNEAVVGSWSLVNVVDSIDAFDPAEKPGRINPPFRHLVLNADGSTDTIEKWWTDDTLIDLRRDYRGSADYQTLKMKSKRIGETDYLFVEAGGFRESHPVDWKSQWVVLKKK